MIYKIITIADIHWGAMDAEETYTNLELFLNYIKKGDIDLVVIAGDYFDYRLPLNSKAALLSLKWFDTLYDTCKESGVKGLRMILGTKDHDNDQLGAIHPNEDSEFFRKFYVNTLEETLPGLTCIYCPDENIYKETYYRRYAENIRSGIDIGFFHGSFDIILPRFVVEQNQEHRTESIIFEKDYWSTFIKGPLIAGHWHTHAKLDSLYYVGSYDRWKFGEEEEKGFLYLEYNTETCQYKVEHINNTLARRYDTIVVDNALVNTPEQFSELLNTIKQLHKKDPKMKIKVKYLLSEDSLTAMNNFNEFRNVISNIKGVKVDVKDLGKREKRKEKRQEEKVDLEKYQYIDPKAPINLILQRFLKEERGIELDLDTIDRYINKYLIT